ncbi:MAG: sirohydrochlorin chelatase [Aureliella sp.]
MVDEVTGTLLALRDIGRNWTQSQARGLAGALEQRLGQRVVVCIEEIPEQTLGAGVGELVEAQVQRLVILPLGLLPDGKHERVSNVIRWAHRQWPELQFHIAPPLTWLECAGWLRATIEEALASQSAELENAGGLLVGQASPSPLANADLARLAQLLRELSAVKRIEHAFIDGRPALAEAVRSLARSGIEAIAAAPWLMGDSDAWQADPIWRELEKNSMRIHFVSAIPSLVHPGLINLLVANYYTALADDRYLRQAGEKVEPASQDSESGARLTDDEAYELQELEKRINAMLPSEYQGRFEEVQPKSMGTAQLKLDADGKVAWDQIWTSFCDLALAGGPPHRGTLLEAVTAEEASSDLERYREVVAEIERGIRMVTGLPVVPSKVLGWVGIRCHSEEMAVWLMRAIIVENVMVRREGDTLYLPAGPKFTLKREIKNVITTIAKTVHYWSAHLKARQNL